VKSVVGAITSVGLISIGWEKGVLQARLCDV